MHLETQGKTCDYELLRPGKAGPTKLDRIVGGRASIPDNIQGQSHVDRNYEEIGNYSHNSRCCVVWI